MCERAKVIVKGRSAYVTTESGSSAFIPVDKLCDVAKRFNLCYENYRC